MKTTVFIYQHSEPYMSEVPAFFRHDALSEAEQLVQKLILVGSAEVEYERKTYKQLQERTEAMKKDAVEEIKASLRKQLEQLENTAA